MLSSASIQPLASKRQQTAPVLTLPPTTTERPLIAQNSLRLQTYCKSLEQIHVVVPARNIPKRHGVAPARAKYHAAANAIQKCWRGYITRKRISWYRAALVIQRSWRRYRREKLALKPDLAKQVGALEMTCASLQLQLLQERQARLALEKQVALLSRQLQMVLKGREPLRSSRKRPVTFQQSPTRPAPLPPVPVEPPVKSKKMTFVDAATILQKVWRGRIDRIWADNIRTNYLVFQMLATHSARVIQRQWRRYSAQKTFITKKKLR